MNQDEASKLKPGDKVAVWLAGFPEGTATVAGFDPWGHVIVSVQFPVYPGQLRALPAAADAEAAR